MSTLLKKLQTALSKVDGNTMTAELPKYDEFWCKVGKHRVYEENYNHKHQCCYQCFWDEGDNTRADDGDEPQKGEL